MEVLRRPALTVATVVYAAVWLAALVLPDSGPITTLMWDRAGRQRHLVLLDLFVPDCSSDARLVGTEAVR
jgi:hypothetical protein